jgi:uncharacterized protein YfdQ (DUF2303 family)
MEGLDTLINALRERPVFKAENGQEQVLVPAGYSVETVSTPPEQNPIFEDGDSLIEYANRFDDGQRVLCASTKTGSVVIALDYHVSATDMVNRDHTAAWQMEKSEEFKAWESWEGTLHEQEDFIRFLEENSGDVVLPDAATLLDLARDFAAIKTVHFKSSKRLASGDREFEYRDETQTADRIKVPEKIILNIPIWEGEDPTEVVCLFRYRMREGALKLGYEFHRVKPVMRASFKLAVTRVAEATGLTPHYGKL